MTFATQHKLLYSRKQAAEALSLSVRALDQLILSGQLGATRVGRRVTCHVDELERFAQHGTRTINISK
jgi:excisionase family DNA binding protein